MKLMNVLSIIILASALIGTTGCTTAQIKAMGEVVEGAVVVYPAGSPIGHRRVRPHGLTAAQAEAFNRGFERELERQRQVDLWKAENDGRNAAKDLPADLLAWP